MTAFSVSGQTTDSLKPADSVRPASCIRYPWPEYRAFQDITTDTLGPRVLSLHMRSTAFFRNNEYKNRFVPGYSLGGVFVEPLLEYRPDAATTIRAGVHLLKYYGRDTLDRILPVFRIQFDASEHISLLFGTIHGTTNHGLIEPVQGFEDYLINNYENGMQVLVNYPQFKSDIWLNWEQFIKKGDPVPEIFTAGTNNEFRLATWKGVMLSAPFSAVLQHVGGEIDSYWIPGGTRMNLVYGLRFHMEVVDRFFTGLYGVQNFVDFVEVNPGSHITIPNGHGNYSRIGFETRIGDFEAGYWNAKDYNSPHGHPLFLSASMKEKGYYQASREMLVLKYQFERDLTRYLKLAIRIEPYYHFDTGRMDHSWGVYLVLNEGFFLAGPGGRRFRPSPE